MKSQDGLLVAVPCSARSTRLGIAASALASPAFTGQWRSLENRAGMARGQNAHLQVH